MLNGLYSAAAGLLAQQARMEALSNDIANVNTAGYKAVRTGFRDLLYNIEGGMRIGAGASVVDGGRTFATGALLQSGSPLSVAIDGPGFFQVRRPDGQLALTRNGDFRVDASRDLVTANGERVWPRITLPAGLSPSDVAIAADGTVTAAGEPLGRILVMSVIAPARLQPSGDSLFLPTAESGSPAAISSSAVRQGYIESSNVDLASALVNVIDAQRGFEFDSRVIKTQDQLMEIANGIRR